MFPRPTMPRMRSLGLMAVVGEFLWASKRRSGFPERAASWDQVRFRKVEMMRKRAESATESEDAAAPLQ